MSDATLVASQPSLQATFFDGSNVIAVYTPSLASTGGYRLTLITGTVPSPPQTNPNPASGWSVYPGAVFSAGAQMALALDTMGAGGSTTAPTLRVAFPQYSGSTPGFAPNDAVVFPDGTLWTTWTPPPAGSANALQSYLLLLRDPNSGRTQTAACSNFAATAAAMLLPAQPAIGNALEFRLLAINANGAGQGSMPLSIIGAAPTQVRVAVGSDAIEVWWTPSTDPATATEVPRLYSSASGWASGTDGTSDRPGHGSIPFNSAGGAQRWYVAVIARGAAQSVGAASTPLPLPLQLPALSALAASSAALQVTVASSNQSGPAGASVLVRALAGSTELARASAQTAPMVLSVDPAAVTQVAWRSSDGGQLGPEQQLAVALAAPPLPSISTDAIAGSSTLQWAPVAGASGYRVDWYPGAAPVLPGNVSQLALPPALQGSALLSARVSALYQSGATAISGLASPPAGPLPPPPDDLNADYDGATVRARWTRRSDVDGYALGVYAAGSSTLATALKVDAAADQAELDLPDNGSDWQLVIQSISGSRYGLPSAALALVAPGWYLANPGSNPVASAGLAPLADAAAVAAFASGKGSERIWLLPALGAAALTGTMPSTASFAISATGNSTWPYQLTIPASSPLWTFDGSALRPALTGDLVSLLEQLESAGGAPWGVDLLQRVIARGAPLTFQETLFVEYGLTGPNSAINQAYGSFDLRPGMLLRVLSPGYLNLDPDLSGQYLNGFAAGSSVDYEIGVDRSNGWRPSLDAFFGQLLALGAISVAPQPSSPGGTTQGGVADAADLNYGTLSTAFLRVIVPTDLLSATSGGSAQAADQYLIAGADSFTTLSSIVSPPGPNTPYAYFRGRALLQARIRIEVNGNAQTVAVGTTVADVLRASGALPANAAAALDGLSLQRRLGPCQTAASAPLDPAASAPVLLGWGGLAAWGDGASALDLPLLAGDELWFA